MSDATSNDENESEDGPVGGERLRAARRANDISVRDVAKELHLDEYKVRALEKNEFDVLGAPVFAKGCRIGRRRY
jgi:ribosome-binding protein aMBF1 (putative translation factor)